MKKRLAKISDFITDVIMMKGCGIVLCVLGVVIFIFSVLKNDYKGILLLLALSYLMVLAGVDILLLSNNSLEYHRLDITLHSYLLKGISPILFFIFIICLLDNRFKLMEKSIIGIICVGCQILSIGAWFLLRLIKKKYFTDLELMRLDLYTTASMIPLTIMWVVFDIGSIMLGFACIMGEFLIIQVWIKFLQIKNMEKNNQKGQ